jgi:hypothetical protein
VNIRLPEFFGNKNLSFAFMLQDQNFDIISWWNDLSFDGKELFTLGEDGKLVIYSGQDGKERLIAELAPENSITMLSTLGEKYYALQARVADTATEWNAAEDKMKMAEKVHSLKNALNNAHAIGNLEKLSTEVAEWDKVISELTEQNYAAKLALTEQAEAIAESNDWKDANAAIRDIIEKWKLTGYADKFRSDKLWNRIEAAKNKFNDRRKQFFEEQEKDLLVNLDLKMDLVEQAESLATSAEWKKTADTFHRLTNEWKTIGHTLSKKNEELWQRFIAAKATFFDRKREHTDRIQKEQEQFFMEKTALAEKAEALKDSTEWNATSLAYAALMEDWKKTGRVNGDRGEEVWARFMAAQEHFFSAKKQHTEGIRTVHEQNYNLKMELLHRANQIKNATQWNDTTAEMNELLDEWKKIGPVARDVSNKIWDEFIAARKHFFARKDANREQRKQFVEVQKQVRTEQAKEMVGKLLTDITEEEEKLVDFAEALKNITPGKKAEELRKHLEKLLAEGQQKIKRLKEKYAAVQDEYGKKATTPAPVTETVADAAPAEVVAVAEEQPQEEPTQTAE